MNNRNTQGGATGIQSVARALAILELFSDRRPALSVSEVADLTGLFRATAYRFCQTLLALGYLEEVDERRFRPGLNAVRLANAALRSRGLPELAAPYLRELRNATGETVNLGLLDGTEIVYVARAESNRILAPRLYVGSRVPAYASSIGRAILAYVPPAEAKALLKRSDRRAITENTITDLDELMRLLDKIRSDGYAVNQGEIATGLRGVAAPILSTSGRPLAGVGISVPRPLDRPSEIKRALAPKVMKTAAAIGGLAAQLSHEQLGAR